MGSGTPRGQFVVKYGDSGKGAFHAHKTAYTRLRPTADARLVYKQLALGMMNWVIQETVTGARFTGTINRQNVLTLSEQCANFLEPVTLVASRMHALLGFNRAQTLSYTRGNGNAAYVRDDRFTPIGTSTTPTNSAAGVRQTWDLGTCWQYRDYLCQAYGLANGNPYRQTGYIPPHMSGVTENVQGLPEWMGPGQEIYERDYTPLPTADGGAQIAVMRRQMLEMRPLFLEYETITWTFTNPTEQSVDIDIYELVPREDVPMVSTPLSSTVATEAGYGRWPDPQYLFQKDLDASQTTASTPNTSVPIDNTGLTGIAGGSRVEWTSSSAQAVTVGGSTQYAQALPTRSINDIGMRPVGTSVRQFYRVSVKRVHLDAGARCTVHHVVKHNRTLGFADLFDTFAVRGRARQYMMVMRGERLVSSMTAGASQAHDTFRAPDVLCEWTKSAKFCRYRIRPRVAHSTLKRAIRTDITGQFDIDPASGDFEQAAAAVP